MMYNGVLGTDAKVVQWYDIRIFFLLFLGVLS